jgi:hypothetical protein
MAETEIPAVGSTRDLDPRVAALVGWAQGSSEPLDERGDVALSALEASLPRAWAAPLLALAATAAYARVPRVGPRDLQTGHRIAEVLGRLGEPGARELVRIRERAYYRYARTRIARILGKSARRLSTPLGELEDSFDGPRLDDDLMMSIPVGPCIAQVGVRDDLRRVGTTWIGSRGNPVRRRPAAALEHPTELELVVPERRRLQAHLGDLRSRLERAMVDGRSWSLGTWTERMFGDPLRAALAGRLIWRIEGSGRIDGVDELVLPCRDGGLADVDGVRVNLGASRNISLWHPVDSTVRERQRWQERLSALEVSQPIDQAAREVTPADPTSPTLMLRAGQQLPQRPFRGFLTNRGWRVPYLGRWFTIPEATRELLPGGPLAVLHLELDEEENETDEIILGELAFRSAHDLGLDARLLPPVMVSESARDVLGAISACASGARPAPG